MTELSERDEIVLKATIQAVTASIVEETLFTYLASKHPDWYEDERLVDVFSKTVHSLNYLKYFENLPELVERLKQVVDEKNSRLWEEVREEIKQTIIAHMKEIMVEVSENVWRFL